MIGSLLLALGDVWMLITQVFVMCLGMFVIHTLAASEVNHNARSLGGVVNGLYVSCYYAGGALGAWLMGYVYELFGWTTFCRCTFMHWHDRSTLHVALWSSVGCWSIDSGILVILTTFHFKQK